MRDMATKGEIGWRTESKQQKNGGACNPSPAKTDKATKCLAFYPKHEYLPVSRKINLAILTDILTEHQLLADFLIWGMMIYHIDSMNY